MKSEIRCTIMKICALGYQMCDEETAWQNGTHELFQQEK